MDLQLKFVMRTSDKTSAFCNLTSNLPKKEKHKTKNKDGQNSIKERKKNGRRANVESGLKRMENGLENQQVIIIVPLFQASQQEEIMQEVGNRRPKLEEK